MVAHLNYTDTPSRSFISPFSLHFPSLSSPLLLEKQSNLEKSALLPRLQSAYRTGHSSETALLKVFSDILLGIDAGDLSALVQLDLFAAFDMVNHDILQQRLERSYGLMAYLVWCVNGSALIWSAAANSSELVHLL